MNKMYNIYLYIFIYINLYKGESGTLVFFFLKFCRESITAPRTTQSGELNLPKSLSHVPLRSKAAIKTPEQLMLRDVHTETHI